jgi:hypothetical protein
MQDAKLANVMKLACKRHGIVVGLYPFLLHIFILCSGLNLYCKTSKEVQ